MYYYYTLYTKLLARVGISILVAPCAEVILFDFVSDLIFSNDDDEMIIVHNE